MLQQHAFLVTASQSFGVNLDPESVADVERADSTFEGPGWTKEGLKALLETLDIHAPTRARVIRRAAEQGGYVSRDEVYELGGYSQSRQLTGWTRPLRTWTEHLRNEGVLGPEDGETDVLYAVYEGASRAKGFRVPQRVLELLEQLDEG